MKLSRIAEAKYFGGRIEPVYALYDTRAGRFCSRKGNVIGSGIQPHKTLNNVRLYESEDEARHIKEQELGWITEQLDDPNSPINLSARSRKAADETLNRYSNIRVITLKGVI